MITIDHKPEPDEGSERREFPRVNIHRQTKLFDPQSGKYHLGSTCDLSACGALLELHRPIGARPGDTILLGIAQKRRQPLLRKNEMIRANVVRTMQAEGGRMLLAAHFPPDAAMPFPVDQPRLAA